jgi:hypothetical protein
MARRRSRRGQHSWHLWLALFKFMLLVALVGAIGFYGYQVGQKLALDEVADARQEVARLTQADGEHQERLAHLQNELEQTRGRADEFQAKYAEIAPSEDMAQLMAALKLKLDAGLDARRLAFVIANAEPPRRCGGETTKRFMVRTPRFDGDSTWVRFADLITVTADGVGAGGGTEQAFDPAKPVTVHFTVIGGKAVPVSGTLPLQHSMVVKGGEYRFTVVSGARGFVEVTGDRCEYRN